MKITSKHDLDKLTQEAHESARKRAHLPLHEKTDPVLKLIMAMEPETYAQPNKHSGESRQELFIALRGKFIVLIFDDTGKVTEHTLIGPDEEDQMVEIPQGTWHTMWSLAEGSIAMEIIKGPYEKETYKEFPSWAPSENDASVPDYKKNILQELKLG